jgi:porphobilinogen synthase
LICPLFVTMNADDNQPLSAIPGARLLAGPSLVQEVRRLHSLSIPAILLFAVVDETHKDAVGSLSQATTGPAHRAIETIKAAVPEMVVIADLCLCEYKTDGHCGLLHDNRIDNDRTLVALQQAALSLARSGADMIAPSGMMDGVVQALRTALDQFGFHQTLLMPYSAKFASSFYGPFKTATRSTPAESRHATHQIDIPNVAQAIREARFDVEEGADILIVKPALSYLDIVAAIKREVRVPVAAYNVSGEYNMVHLLAGNQVEYRQRVMLESLLSIRRAGADMIITYFAAEAAQLLG